MEALEGYDAERAHVYAVGEVQCTGSEDRLFDCPRSILEINECDGSYVAGVKCLSGMCEFLI